MRICYVTTDSLSEGVGNSQIVPLLIGVAKAGHDVSVISMEKWENKNIQKRLEQSGITWICLEFGRRGLTQGIFRLFKLVRSIPDADIYHARSDIPALSLIIRRRRPILWDVRSLWMEQRSLLSNRRYIFRFLSAIWVFVEKFIVKRASAVNTLTNELQQVLENRLGEIPILRTVIPTSVVLSRFNFVDKLPAEKTIMMSGTLNGYYDKNLTERVMQTFADEGYRTKWCRPRESTSSSLNVRNAEILEVHHEEMPSQIATASIGLAICRDDVGISLKGVMPTKVPEFLAVGRPVIISKGMGDLDQLIELHNVGIMVDSSMGMHKLVQLVEALMGDPETPNRCRALAATYFDMDSAVNSYLSTYSALGAEVRKVVGN